MMDSADRPQCPLPLSAGTQLVHRYVALGPPFVTPMPPEGVAAAPHLLHLDAAAIAAVGLDPASLDHDGFLRILTGSADVAGAAPFASVYAGHQFGHFVPQLGDGRALTIAELTSAHAGPWELQLKGAGRTPYSRFGDGRAVMRSTIREYLASAYMRAIGMPTTLALALAATGEGVSREQLEPGAVLLRAAPSHIRFGYFEFFHYRGEPENVRRLGDFVLQHVYPELADTPDPFRAMFGEIVRRTATLMALWQATGFTHGVMNTDNMSICGLTIDYGPYGFLDRYNPAFVPNHTDRGGRYAFGQQPLAGHWNLRALAAGMSSILPISVAAEILETYAAEFDAAFYAAMRDRLALSVDDPEAEEILRRLFRAMRLGAADYSATLRALGTLGDPAEARAYSRHFGAEGQPDAAQFLAMYAPRAQEAGHRARIEAANPRFVLRNWVAEDVIRAVEDRGDLSVLARAHAAASSPFNPSADELVERWLVPPPPDKAGIALSCSS